jgi:hypothetical protein
MPALYFTRQLQPRETPGLSAPPPFPPFRSDDDNNSLNPFRIDPDDDHDDDNLSPGIIAAIVVSIVVFLIVLTGLLAFLAHRRRKARQDEIAMKEENVSVTAVTASGALDPPPPYDEVQRARQAPARAHSWEGRSDVTGSEEEEEDSDAMGSHATITDGVEPGRHSGSGVS